MRLDAFFFSRMMVAMNNLTPEEVRERAYMARISLNQLLARAGVNNSTFWRWAGGSTTNIHPVTIGKIADALADVERERAA